MKGSLGCKLFHIKDRLVDTLLDLVQRERTVRNRSQPQPSSKLTMEENIIRNKRLMHLHRIRDDTICSMENLERQNHGSLKTPNRITIGERKGTIGDSEATTWSSISSPTDYYNKYTFSYLSLSLSLIHALCNN